MTRDKAQENRRSADVQKNKVKDHTLKQHKNSQEFSITRTPEDISPSRSP